MLFVLLLGGWGYLSLPPNIQADPKCRITCYWRVGLAWCSKNQCASPAGFEIQYVSKGLKAGSLLQIGILAGIPVIQLLLALPSFPSVLSSNERVYHHIFAHSWVWNRGPVVPSVWCTAGWLISSCMTWLSTHHRGIHRAGRGEMRLVTLWLSQNVGVLWSEGVRGALYWVHHRCLPMQRPCSL